MRKLLDEISVIPGVSGSCIFDKTDGTLCSDFDTDLPRDLTRNVGIHFVRLMQMGTMNKLNIKSAHFRFDRYSVVGMPLHTGAILLTICDSQANCSLVATTAAMLVEDMRDELEKPAASGQAGAPQEAVRDSEGTGPAGGVDKVGQRHFEEIENALTATIGPVAGMIMSDCINRWKQSGPPSLSRLLELTIMHVGEVSGAGLAKEFKDRVKHLL